MLRCIISAVVVAVSWTTLEGAIVKKPIEYKHGDVTLEGYLAYDDARPGKLPGVLVVHEWWGLNDYAKGRAEQLAKLGYIAFAVDMYGKGVSTTKPDEAGKLAGKVRPILRDRAKAGLDVLLSQPNVDKDHVAAIGYCFGGTTVLELAFSGAPLAGVVSFHGNLPQPSAEDLKRTKAKILVCHGAADTFLNDKQISDFQKALDSAKLDWQMIYYGGAVHAFTNPGADKVGLQGVAYDKNADARSWRLMRDFFDEVLGKVKAAIG